MSVRSLRFSSGLLKVLMVLNFICLLMFAGVGLGSFVVENRVLEILTRNHGGEAWRYLTGMRQVLLLGAITVWPAHLILTRLRLIVLRVGEGEAFTSRNAARLKIIAWSLLAIQFLDLGFGWISYRFDDLMGWTPSVTAWLAVLLLFVLARVFEQGAIMRDELDATV